MSILKELNVSNSLQEQVKNASKTKERVLILAKTKKYGLSQIREILNELDCGTNYNYINTIVKSEEIEVPKSNKSSGETKKRVLEIAKKCKTTDELKMELMKQNIEIHDSYLMRVLDDNDVKITKSKGSYMKLMTVKEVKELLKNKRDSDFIKMNHTFEIDC